MNFETTGINYVIIQIVSTEILIPADSVFVVVKTSQSFQSFRKTELDIIEKFART